MQPRRNSLPLARLRTSSPGIAVIDYGFQYLGVAGNYVRFIKNATYNTVYQENTTGELFETWTRIPGMVTAGNHEEGTATCANSLVSDKYHSLLDNYKQYMPFESTSVQTQNWKVNYTTGFPVSLKYGSVTPLIQAEYDKVFVKCTNSTATEGV